MSPHIPLPDLGLWIPHGDVATCCGCQSSWKIDAPLVDKVFWTWVVGIAAVQVLCLHDRDTPILSLAHPPCGDDGGGGDSTGPMFRPRSHEHTRYVTIPLVGAT